MIESAPVIDATKFGAARIVSRRDFHGDLWVMRITTDFPLGFRPGQYCTLALPVGGRLVERPYSICSSPEEAEIELFIERVPNGELTVPLYELGVGAEMPVRRRCKGLFLREAPVAGHDHLFIATVTGIAPFLSFLRTLRRRADRGEWKPEARIVLLHGASVSGEHGYLGEMRALESAVDWFTYIPTISRPWLDPDWPGEVGRVEDVIRKHADRLDLRPGSASAFICGNPQMIDNVKGALRRRGFEEATVHEEQYWPE
ncbi:MAG TPA: FAD-binding oxidoreductase [Candidatus Binatia bacterium]|nr:FAD-binding oxidoreductase [Candidatus Binatia bacterium]